MEFDDRNLTKAEREKILEVLLSQERVLTLLYDKTFPPRPSSQGLAVGGARGLLGTSMKGGQTHSKSMKSMNAGDKEQMRQFNYYGQTRLENLDEHDIVGLEREIDYIIRHSQLGSSPLRQGTAPGGHGDYGMSVNIKSTGGVQGPNMLPPKRHRTAGVSHNPRAAKKKLLKQKREQMQATGDYELNFAQMK